MKYTSKNKLIINIFFLFIYLKAQYCCVTLLVLTREECRTARASKKASIVAYTLLKKIFCGKNVNL